MGIAERKEREKRHRRNQILKAAKKLFSARGFSGVTMENIAAESELSPSTLYFYFKNKEELYAALSIKAIKSLLESLEKAVEADNQSPEKMLMRLKDEFCRLCEFDSVLLLDVFNLQTSAVYRDLSDTLVNEIKSFATQTIRFLAQIFDRGIRQGIFKQYPPIALADMLWSLFSGMVI